MSVPISESILQTLLKIWHFTRKTQWPGSAEPLSGLGPTRYTSTRSGGTKPHATSSGTHNDEQNPAPISRLVVVNWRGPPTDNPFHGCARPASGGFMLLLFSGMTS